MVDYIKLFLFLYNILLLFCCSHAEIDVKNYTKIIHYVAWPNATVPFFINPDHFDNEQSLAITKTLSMFAFKTCLKFAPVMAPPEDNQHVLTFVNPEGIRRCVIDIEGHSVFDPHYLIVGYDCLKAPHLEMLIMKALGFPFEQNRHSRDVFIEVLFENIEPGSIGLFTKDSKLPQDLQNLPYDYNSVMHFGDREYSKNGHRTIIFRDHKIKQNRISLSATDLRKIEIVYGPECLKRDRQDKIDLCQEYPGVARRKREIEDEVRERSEINNEQDIQISLRKKRSVKDFRIKLEDIKEQEIGARKKRDIDDVAKEGHDIDNQVRVKFNIDYDNKVVKVARKKRNAQLEPVINLRVNRNIKPPDSQTNLTDTLKILGIEKEAMEIVEKVYKISSLALLNARDKYCNTSKVRPNLEPTVTNSSNIVGIIESVANYAVLMVENAMSNLTVFCENSSSIDQYQRARCPFYDSYGRCMQTYRSTKSGAVRHSTKHRPTYFQHTKHDGFKKNHNYINILRSANGTESLETTTELKVTESTVTESTASEKSRKKREVGTTKFEEEITLKPDNEVAGNENDTPVVIDQSKKGVENMEKLTTDVNVVNNLTNVNQVNLNKTGAEKSTDVAETTISEGFAGREQRNGTMNEIVVDSRRNLKERKQNSKSKLALRSGNANSGEWTPPASVEKRKKKKSIKKERKVASMSQKDNGLERIRFEKQSNEEISSQKKTRYVPKTLSLTKANMEFYKERKWPNGVVRYIIKEDPEYDMEDLRDRISEVNNILQKKTCVRMIEITESSANKYDDYLVLDTSPDYVTGRVGGRQNFGSLEVFQGHQHRQHTAMMVMAMLGFYFELSRHDRDKHVRVHMRHVRPDKLHHFEKIRDEATFALPYDYESATHPAWQFWRKVGKTGISTVATYKDQDPDGSVMQLLGQHKRLLSDLDIIKINSIYGVKCFQRQERKEERYHSTD